MADMIKDKTILDFSKVEDILRGIRGIGTWKGVVIYSGTVAAVEEIVSVIDDWGSGNPAAYHTLEGLDALKQRIHIIRVNNKYDSKARLPIDIVCSKISFIFSMGDEEFKGYSVSEAAMLVMGDKELKEFCHYELAMLAMDEKSALDPMEEIGDDLANEVFKALLVAAIIYWVLS